MFILLIGDDSASFIARYVELHVLKEKWDARIYELAHDCLLAARRDRAAQGWLDLKTQVRYVHQ